MPHRPLNDLTLTQSSPSAEEASGGLGPWRVLLFNDQTHSFTEVILLLALATGYSLERCQRITMEAHLAGRAEVTRTDEGQATRIVGILRRGGLLAAMRPT
jgi:ATP-dependent Clp protease adaptor protein ClpS